MAFFTYNSVHIWGSSILDDEKPQSIGGNVGNVSLKAASKAKDDEFYTCYDDIEKELNHYAKYFKGKIIYCNCDDHAGIGLGTPKSNFLKYFADNFEAFGIKKVIATHYERDGSSTMYILDKDNTGDGVICSEDIEEIPLKSNGDFRSDECIKLLKQADIVVTNPPFSLFREYVAQLMEYNKKFVIIGNKNALSYREIFPLIKENKMWLGYNSPSNFIYNNQPTKKVNGLTRWFTNLPTTKRSEILETGKKYCGYENMYPKYDNYDAIEVSKTSDIPMDYNGLMGVPITFIDKYNPEQFEIIGLAPERSEKMILKIFKYENAIQYNKDGTTSGGNKVNDGPTLLHETIPDKFPYYTCENREGYIEVLYARILIKKKKGN